MQIVVTFLAVLELMKYGVIEASQRETDGDIEITRAQELDVNRIRDRYEEEN